MCMSWPWSPISVNAHWSALAFYKAKNHDKVHPFGKRFLTCATTHTHTRCVCCTKCRPGCMPLSVVCLAQYGAVSASHGERLRGMERHFLLSIEAAARMYAGCHANKAPLQQSAMLCLVMLLANLMWSFSSWFFLSLRLALLQFSMFTFLFLLFTYHIHCQAQKVATTVATLLCRARSTKMAATALFIGKESFALLILSLDCRLLSLFKLRTSTTTVIVIMYANAARTMVAAIAVKKCI